MRIGIAVLIVAVLGLVALLAAVGFDDFRVRRQLIHERVTVSGEARKAQALTSNQLAEARAEIVRLNNEIAFPIHITQKKAPAGGYVVQVFNSSEQSVQVTITYSNPTSKKSKNFDFELSPGFSREIGRLEGWTAATGDSLQIGCPGFLPIKRILR